MGSRTSWERGRREREREREAGRRTERERGTGVGGDDKDRRKKHLLDNEVKDIFLSLNFLHSIQVLVKRKEKRKSEITCIVYVSRSV